MTRASTLLLRIKEASDWKKVQATIGSDELSMLYVLIATEEGSAKYLMSSDGDEEWELAQEDGGWADRETWAKETEQFNIDLGYPGLHFTRPKIVQDAWLVHFTDSDPLSIIKSGFRGRDTYGIGLTTQYKPDANPGHLAFGYPADAVKEPFRYGKNAVLLEVKQAVEAYHHGDSELQAIFDTREVLKMLPIYVDPETGESVLYDLKGKELARCDGSRGCFSSLTDVAEKTK